MGIRRNIIYEERGQCLSHTHRERSHLRLLVVRRTWGRDREGSCCSYRKGLLRPRQEQQPKQNFLYSHKDKGQTQ